MALSRCWKNTKVSLASFKRCWVWFCSLSRIPASYSWLRTLLKFWDWKSVKPMWGLRYTHLQQIWWQWHRLLLFSESFQSVTQIEIIVSKWKRCNFVPLSLPWMCCKVQVIKMQLVTRQAAGFVWLYGNCVTTLCQDQIFNIFCISPGFPWIVVSGRNRDWQVDTSPRCWLNRCGQQTLILVSLSLSDEPQLSQDSTEAPGPASVQASLTDAAGDELPPPLPANNSTSSGMLSEPPGFESLPQPVSVPSPVPLPVPSPVPLPVPSPVPLSVPAFVNGCRNSQPCSLLKPSQDFDGDIIGDDLDKLLDQAEPESAMVRGPKQGGLGCLCFVELKWRECACVWSGLWHLFQGIPTVKGPLPLPTSIASGGSMPSSFRMPSSISPFVHSGLQQCTVTLPPLYHKSGSISYFGMDKFDTLPQRLDTLDSLSMTDFDRGSLSNWFAVETETSIFVLISLLC